MNNCEGKPVILCPNSCTALCNLYYVGTEILTVYAEEMAMELDSAIRKACDAHDELWENAYRIDYETWTRRNIKVEG